MKVKVLSLLAVFTLFLSSCKDKEATKEGNGGNPFFSVDMQVTTKKTDNFCMYFSEDGTTNFKDNNAIWKGVNGGKEKEIVSFALTDEKIPTHIRLDFGLKQDQDSVVVKNIKVDYYGNTYEFKGSDFFNYFIKDEQFLTKIDSTKGTLTILAKEGVYKTPYYYPTQLTIDKIREITTKK